VIDNELRGFGGPEWHIQEVVLAEASQDRHILLYRNAEKLSDHLFGAPRFAGKMAFSPVVKIGTTGKRVFDEVNTGDRWNAAQVSRNTMWGISHTLIDWQVIIRPISSQGPHMAQQYS
jgi:hypothetical protein